MTPCKALVIAGYFDHLKEQGILIGHHLAEATADELRRLSAIEQAATVLIKCKDCQDADVAAQGLADALGIELPRSSCEQQGPVNLGPLLHAFSFVCKNHTPKDFLPPLGQSVLAAVLLEALWPHLSDNGRKSHRAVVDAMAADHSNTSHAIELQAAEVGIPEPVTELINPCKEAGQS